MPPKQKPVSGDIENGKEDRSIKRSSYKKYLSRNSVDTNAISEVAESVYKPPLHISYETMVLAETN